MFIEITPKKRCFCAAGLKLTNPTVTRQQGAKRLTSCVALCPQSNLREPRQQHRGQGESQHDVSRWELREPVGNRRHADRLAEKQNHGKRRDGGARCVWCHTGGLGLQRIV
jgi:hypothetical protein